MISLKTVQGLAVIAVAATLSTQCLAQQHGPFAQQNGPDAGQCEQVRAAVAEHGLAAARKHAMENYGLTKVDLRRVEQECGIGRGKSKRTDWALAARISAAAAARPRISRTA